VYPPADPNARKKPQVPGVSAQMANTQVQAPGLLDASAPPAPPATTNAAPAPAPAAPAGPVYENLNGMHGYRMPNGGWVPGDHPIALGAGATSINPNAGGPAVAPTPAGTPAATPGAAGAPAGQPTTQPGVLNGTAVAGAQTPQGAPTTVAGAFQQALINRLAPQDITSQNPAIKGSIAANRNAEARGLSKTQEALAERGAATGQTGGQETGLRQAIGESSGRQGAYEGNALMGLHQQQQADLTSALGLGGSLLSDQQRNDTSRYGLDLDAALRREGLGAQTQLGNRELDIRNTLGQGNLGLGYAGLQQNGQQFQQNLGAQLGLGTAQLNQSALLALLNGL
jgi:hypothetical protein